VCSTGDGKGMAESQVVADGMVESADRGGGLIPVSPEIGAWPVEWLKAH